MRSAYVAYLDNLFTCSPILPTESNFTNHTITANLFSIEDFLSQSQKEDPNKNSKIINSSEIGRKNEHVISEENQGVEEVGVVQVIKICQTIKI